MKGVHLTLHVYKFYISIFTLAGQCDMTSFGLISKQAFWLAKRMIKWCPGIVTIHDFVLPLYPSKAINWNK